MTGPALPPDIIEARRKRKQEEQSSVFIPSHDHDKDTDNESDDDVGPMLADESDKLEKYIECPKLEEPAKEQSGTVGRESWMTEMSSAMPSNMKSRGFRKDLAGTPIKEIHHKEKPADDTPRASLYSEHAVKRQKANLDQASARPFDREKDIVRGTTASKTRRFAEESSNFGSTFDSGSYL